MKQFHLALRSLLHYKQYSAINVLGLILSLSCFIMISRYVYSEISVDRFNQNLDRMFVSATERADNPGVWQFDGIQPHDARELQSHPGIEKLSSYFKMTDDIIVDNRTYSTDVLVADEHFLTITCYPIIWGNRPSSPNEVLISTAFAEKVFGNQNPIGKVITYSYVLQKTATIVGVVDKPSTKSSLSFDLFVPMEIVPGGNWGRQKTLFLLYPNVSFEDINRQFSEPMILRGVEQRVQLIPYRDIYFSTRVADWRNYHKTGNYSHIIILSLVGLLILLIGAINYANVYTVVILRRNKEFGMKKIFGASGREILAQLFSENIFLITISLILTFGVVQLATTTIQNLLGMEQVLNSTFDIWLSVLLVSVLSILTSAVPYIHYNYTAPIKSLRSVILRENSMFSRRTFLVLQYVITLVMITVSLFFAKQLHYMLNTDLGFRTENIIRVSFARPIVFTMDANMNAVFERQNQRLENLQHKMNASPLFTTWAWGRTPNEISTLPTYEFRVPGSELQSTTFIQVDEHWLELFEIDLIAGRGFNREQDIWSYNLIVSESALRQFGINNFNEAQLVPSHPLQSLQNIPGNENNPPFRIVGVVRDFHPAHLSQHQYPIIFHYSPFRSHSSVLASFHPANQQQVIDFMRNVYDELISSDFSFSFIEDEMAVIYQEDRKIVAIYSVFTFIAIFISALGLFALSLFDIKQRRKEIAIRKVNGAMTKDVVLLFFKKYATLLSIAFLISLPISLFAIHKYLEGFAYRASITWWLFAVSLTITVVVSLLTLIFQIYKASNENLVNVIKSN